MRRASTTARRAQVALLFAALCARPAPAAGGADAHLPDAAAVERFTGSHTRLAWVRDGRLAQFDTRDGRGVVLRDVQGAPGRPIITPSGRAVVFIAPETWSSWVLPWDGGAPARLAHGRVTHVRMDGQGAEWAYWQTTNNEIRTARLDAPDAGQVVWRFPFPPRERKTENWQTSADGLRAAATVPWPHIGVAALPRQGDAVFTRLGVGCWPQIARDNSYRVFHLHGGTHNRLAMFDATGTEAWYVPCVPNPARSGTETPRWANNPRFVAATDQSWHDLPPDVYLGRFDREFRRFEAWLRITDEGHNADPDCWLASAASYPPPHDGPAEILAGKSAPEASWPSDHRGLAFVWSNLSGDNVIRGPDGQPLLRCSALLRGDARPTRHNTAELTGGRLAAEGLPPDFADRFRVASAFTFEATLSPRAATNGTLMAFGPSGRPNLCVEQQGPDIGLCWPAGSSAEPLTRVVLGRLDGRVAAGQWIPSECQHVVVSIARKRAVLYVNGTLRGSAAVRTLDFRRWQPGPLVFGGDSDGRDGWQGEAQCVAVYARALDAELIARKTRLLTARLSSRDTARSYAIAARLVAATPVPVLAQILPYPRALVVNAYDVVPSSPRNPIRGRIHIAHWAYLDNHPVPVAAVAGDMCRFTVEPFPAALDGERLVSAFTDPEASLYLDVSR